jgi:hypothetical protein
MQPADWKALLRRIPTEHHENLMVMTKAGSEFNLQNVVRVEEGFMLVRGRIAGSNDAGRIFLLSFAQIDHMGFQRPVGDDILNAIFAPAEIPAALPSPELPAPADELPPPAVAETTPAPPAPPPSTFPREGLRKTLPSKSQIIERLRVRTAARDGTDSAPAVQ